MGTVRVCWGVVGVGGGVGESRESVCEKNVKFSSLVE